MLVRLESVATENFQEVVGLSVAEEQSNFVTTNAYSLAEVFVKPTWVPKAIFAGDELVGFLMYDSTDCELVRMMIDSKYQGKGYGAGAMRALIDEFETDCMCTESKTSYVVGNKTAERLYRSIGYVPTGEIKDGEVLIRRTLRHQR